VWRPRAACPKAVFKVRKSMKASCLSANLSVSLRPRELAGTDLFSSGGRSALAPASPTRIFQLMFWHASIAGLIGHRQVCWYLNAPPTTSLHLRSSVLAAHREGPALQHALKKESSGQPHQHQSRAFTADATADVPPTIAGAGDNRSSPLREGVWAVIWSLIWLYPAAFCPPNCPSCRAAICICIQDTLHSLRRCARLQTAPP